MYFSIINSWNSNSPVYPPKDGIMELTLEKEQVIGLFVFYLMSLYLQLIFSFLFNVFWPYAILCFNLSLFPLSQPLSCFASQFYSSAAYQHLSHGWQFWLAGDLYVLHFSQDWNNSTTQRDVHDFLCIQQRSCCMSPKTEHFTYHNVPPCSWH